MEVGEHVSGERLCRVFECSLISRALGSEEFTVVGSLTLPAQSSVA